MEPRPTARPSLRDLLFTMSALLWPVLFLLALAAPAFAADSTPKKVELPAGLDHAAFDRLLQKYVDDRGLVAYGKWKENAGDVAALDAYLAQLAPAPGKKAKGVDLAASVINAYNATGIRFIIEHYPLKSIRDFADAFSARTHLIGGEKVSLDDIENGTARPLIGWKAHAGLVCCAKSCPPLRRTAFTAANLDQLIGEAYRDWLARPDLNQFLPDKNLVKISSIFNWFKDDFEKAGGVKKILAQYAPEEFRQFLKRGDYAIEYLDYNWALNDQARP